MGVFKDYEAKAIRILVDNTVPEEQLSDVLANGALVSFEHTGVGYILTVRHAALPAGRVVCHEPLLVGATADLQFGFVVFLEAGQLTLECHSWGSDSLPDDLRDQPIELRT